MTQQSSDFVDLIRTFNEHQVDYLIVGAHALAAHGHVRATKDLDVWVRPDPENAKRVFTALAVFGAPLDQVSIDDFSQRGTIFQIGVDPLRIDIITSVSGLEFADAVSDCVATHFGGLPTHVLSKRALITNKTASGRKQDLADLERLTNPED